MRTCLLGVAALCVLLAGCSDGRQQAASLETDLAAIRDVNERTLEALNDGDWAMLNEIIDDDYVSIIGGTPVAGKERHHAANRRFLEQWHNEEEWIPEETIVDGDLAFQRGAFTMTLTPRQGDGAARSMAGTYLHIYQRKADGAWALTRAMAGTAEN
jgi:ketosteroid isomerase-like protein